MELTIVEKKQKGRSVINFSDNKMPLVSIGKTQMSFNQTACEKLKIKSGSSIMFAHSETGSLYFAVLNETSEMIGYILRKHPTKSNGNLTTQSIELIKRLKQSVGVYFISGFPVFNQKTGLEWFELTPRKD